MEGSVNVLAFCPLLWQANKGPVDEEGNPIISDGRGTRGNCTKPYDCANCPVMKATLEAMPGDTAVWICQDCVTKSRPAAEYYRIEIELLSYYMEGHCQRYNCDRAEEDRWSPLLQLLVVTGSDVP